MNIKYINNLFKSIGAEKQGAFKVFWYRNYGMAFQYEASQFTGIGNYRNYSDYKTLNIKDEL